MKSAQQLIEFRTAPVAIFAETLEFFDKKPLVIVQLIRGQPILDPEITVDVGSHLTRYREGRNVNTSTLSTTTMHLKLCRFIFQHSQIIIPIDLISM
jgi:hypothetical protein